MRNKLDFCRLITSSPAILLPWEPYLAATCWITEPENTEKSIDRGERRGEEEGVGIEGEWGEARRVRKNAGSRAGDTKKVHRREREEREMGRRVSVDGEMDTGKEEGRVRRRREEGEERSHG